LSRAHVDRLLIGGFLILVGIVQWLLLARMFSTNPFFDEGTYLSSLADLQHGFALGKDVFASQPPLFYDLLRGLAVVFEPTLHGMRAATAATTLLVIPASFVTGRALVGSRAGLVAATMLAIAPPFPLYGSRIFADTPSLALAGVAVAFAAVGGAEAAAVVLAAAVLVKLSAVTAAPVVVALLLLERIAPVRFFRAAGAAAALVAVVALAHLSGLSDIWHDAITYHEHATSSTVSLSNGHELRGFFNLKTPFFWLLVVAACCAVGASWRVRALWLWPAAAVLFVATHSPLHENHLLTLPFAFAPAVGAGLGAGLGRLRRFANPAIALVTLLVAAGLVQQARNLDSERLPVDDRLVQVANRVEHLTRPGDLIVSDQPYVPVLAHRLVPPDLVDTANLRFETGYLSAARVETAIRDYHVRIVVAGRAFLDQPALVAWLARAAVSRIDVGNIRIYRLGALTAS
jgi:4-amino-4-deoxy-L-arabinose transferase-like glycosyltransferase